jgi:hypothetical protein
MKSLNFYEIGVDSLPIDGTQITIFDKQSQFGMFENHFERHGKVEYLYGDIADSLEEALDKGGWINTDINKQDLDDNLLIPLSLEGGELFDGIMWVYEHEYMAVLDDHFFPFQDPEYWDIAFEHGWMEFISKRIDVVKDGEPGCLKGWEETHWQYYTVEFNDKTFEVLWISNSSDKLGHLQSYEVVDS